MWLILLLIIFCLYSLAPGLAVLRLCRPLRLNPVQKLLVAVAASYALIYLASFGIYLLKLDAGRNAVAHGGLSAICFLLLLVQRREAARLVRWHAVRRILAAQSLFIFWGLLLISFICHYGGGTWTGDWTEQYERSVFFLDHTPTTTLMMGKFPLPARPPMMNLIAASFMAQVGGGYEVFQVVYLLLNCLVLLPCCLLAGMMLAPLRGSGGTLRRLPFVLLLLLAANPMVCQNLGYAWTKLFTAFYVILAITLYLRGWRTQSSGMISAAFVSVSAGFLVHHSAGPYALMLGLHYLAVVAWMRRRPLSQTVKEAILRIGLPSALLLATWFAFSISFFGRNTALTSNSTISDSAIMTPRENALNIVRNMTNTLIPSILRHPGLMSIEELNQPSRAGQVRDFMFLNYQVTLTFGLGSFGGIAIIALLWRLNCAPVVPSTHATGSPSTPFFRERLFWLGITAVVFIAGVAVYGGTDRFGVAHICLQGLILTGLCFLAVGLPRLPIGLRWALVAALALDFSLGILLQVTLEHRDVEQVRQQGNWLAEAPQFNSAVKMFPGKLLVNKADQGDHDPHLNRPLTFFGDHLPEVLPLQQVALSTGFLGLVWLAFSNPPGEQRHRRRRRALGKPLRRARGHANTVTGAHRADNG